MPSRTSLLTLAAVVLTVGPLAAQPASPPPPAEYDVGLRFLIDAYRDQRVVQHRALMEFLESVGFRRGEMPETEPEDPRLNLMAGRIAGKDALKLLQDGRVRALFLTPAGVAPRTTPEDRIWVDITIVGGRSTQGQREHREEMLRLLAPIGFHDAVGYDHRGFTRLLGWVPGNKVTPFIGLVPVEVIIRPRGVTPPGEPDPITETRDVLKEYEFQPAEGFDDRGGTRLVGLMPVGRLSRILPDLRDRLPVDRLSADVEFRTPVRVLEVRPDLQPPADPPADPEIPPGQEKLTPDLRALIAAGDAAPPQVRLEVILNHSPDVDDRVWVRDVYRAQPGILLEGRLGQMITLSARPADAVAIAALPRVSTVRLARTASQPIEVSEAQLLQVLNDSGLARRFAGGQGPGIRVVILDTDFRGWQAEKGKGLPADTALVDLTAERNTSILPDPETGTGVGHGTSTAMLVARAAPGASLTLVRVAPDAPYEVQTVARLISGEPLRSIALDRRSQELDAGRLDINTRRVPLLEERRAVLDNFSQDEDFVKRREAYFAAQKAFDEQERALGQRIERFLALVKALRGLRGTQLVVSSLVWNEGQPLDGASTLSRYFDDEPFQAAPWLQSSGGIAGQGWTELFRDLDHNGVMEFAAPDTWLRPTRWTSELNFLGWSTDDGKVSPELPAGAKVRLALQWQEAHDPDFWRDGIDAFRTPLANFRLEVVRQLDPEGKQVPADTLSVVASSSGLPQRLENHPSYSVYEQTVTLDVPGPGRYALRIVGTAPEGTRPADAPTLPGVKQTSELRPRLFLRPLAGVGRPVFVDFFVPAGAVGVPTDARRVRVLGR